MAFTHEEQAVLSQLAYYDISTSPGKPVSLDEVLNNDKIDLDKKLGKEYADVLKGLRKKVAGKDYHIVYKIDDDANTGFVSYAIADPNNEVTVVCRGSEDLSKVLTNKDSQKDLDTDLQIALRQETDQQQKMEEMMDYLGKKGYDGYYFTGHSLGGNLAIHGAVYLGDTNKVKGVTTFNAPGFNDNYWHNHGIRMKQLNGKITNYENEYDIVSSLFTKPGKTHYVDSNAPGTSVFDHHSICNFKFGPNGFKKVKFKGLDTLIPFLLTNVVVDVFWDLNLFGKYLFAKITGSSIVSFRDFSQSALDMMLDAVQETEDEAWWRVDRWDCWYRLDKAFGGTVMNFQYLTGDVDTYYRKVIDMNDASKADIRAIFEKVYDIDNSYSREIGQAAFELNSTVATKMFDLCNSISVPG